MKLSHLFLLLTIFALTACDNKKSAQNDMYFGGLIVNPTSKFVVLLKRDVVIDTFYLDENNRFGGNLKNAEKGIYAFKHPPENQILYMEPGDSTLLRLNTLEFDESLIFSGKGAEKSNYLNKMYLLNQQNNDLILSYYKRTPADFTKTSDSIRTQRREYLTELNKRHNFSKDFLELAQETINYEFYDLRERYAYLIRKYSPESIGDLPEDFHDYRKNISFDNESLENYYVYLNFIDDMLRTKSLEYCEREEPENPECSNPSSPHNIKIRISLLDSLVTNERIKNVFLDRLVAQGIIYSRSKEEIISILQKLEKCKYTGDKAEDLRQMGGIQNLLLPGNNLGEFKLLNQKRDTIALKNISNKPKISYHWSVSSQRHHKWQHKLINNMREKYPEIDFIGVNIDKDQVSEWQNAIKNNGYIKELEFKISIFNLNEDLLKNFLNKLIFLDASGKIVKGNVQLNSLDMETRILEFLSEG